MNKTKGGIYKITNIIKGNFYIGSSIKVEKRMYEHKRMLRKNKHTNIHLQRSWNKYGEKDFEFRCIRNVENERDLIRIEQFYINMYLPKYNICKVAGNHLGIRCSKETKKKISESRKGQKPWNKGIPLSKETKEKLSIALKGRSVWNKGKKMSKKYCEKMAEAQKKRFSTQIHPMTNKHHSNETKEKIRKSRIGRVSFNEGMFKKGMTPWNKGVPTSKEAKEKMKQTRIKNLKNK